MKPKTSKLRFDEDRPCKLRFDRPCKLRFTREELEIHEDTVETMRDKQRAHIKRSMYATLTTYTNY